MKKLMKKRVSFFGKELSVLALLVVGMIGLGTAALVPYLSNSVDGSASVSSPVTMSIDDDIALSQEWVSGYQIPDEFEGDNVVDTISALGGDERNIWVYIDNDAESVVQTYIQFNISNDEGLDEINDEVEQIVAINAYDWERDTNGDLIHSVHLDYDYSVTYNADGSATILVPTYLYADTTEDESTSQGDDVFAEVVFNFPLNAHGTYTLSGQVLA